ncbi:anti-sigma factor family protein [Kitasatospora sp. NPDC088391]|uniref:anti-sigma factor n=1 Tax=Kitasatospora sp. NPDC088391 TaxID=3364074 RepID=UPI0037FE4E61
MSTDPTDPADPTGTAEDPHGDPHADPHEDLAAHLLGVLEPERADRFAVHLAHCPRCAAGAADLAPTAALLAELPCSKEQLAEAGPPPELLDRLLAEVAGDRRRGRVRRRVLVAVAAVLALGGPAATWAALAPTPSPGPVAVAEQRFSAVDPATGVSATVGVGPAAWGSRITLDLGHVPGPQTCELVAVAADGTRQTVTSWSVPATGYGATTGLRTAGGTGLAPSALARFEVRSGQTVLVTVPVSAPVSAPGSVRG